MSTRRPAPAHLSLLIPQPGASPLDSPAMANSLHDAASSDSPPVTPPCTAFDPFLPPAGMGPRGNLIRRNSSLSSCSSTGDEYEEEPLEWNAEEIESLRTVSLMRSRTLARSLLTISPMFFSGDRSLRFSRPNHESLRWSASIESLVCYRTRCRLGKLSKSRRTQEKVGHTRHCARCLATWTQKHASDGSRARQGARWQRQYA